MTRSISKEDLSELQNTPDQAVADIESTDEQENEVSIDELKDQEASEISESSENQDQ